jgi:serine protease AprX
VRRATLLLAVLVAALAGAGIGGADVGWDRPSIGAVPSVGELSAGGGEPEDRGLARVAPSVAAAAQQATPGTTLDLLVSLDQPAGAELKARLAELGTWSWAFSHVPVAAIRLPTPRLAKLQALPGVRAVHQEERLEYLLDDTAQAMDAHRAWDQLGITGAGVTVAVIDSGVDFTHPDLAPALRANYKMTGFGEGSPIPIPVPVPPLPAPHTDITAGHGTHVAGDVAGRGTASGGKYRGMAPGAGLVGLAAGDGLTVSVFAVVEAYDWLVEHHDEYGIRIVNNSYGHGFGPFDPDNPINLATRAAADAGLLVVFAYGNDGGEMTANELAAAPWVLGVAAGTKSGAVAEFSSGGIEADVFGPSLENDRYVVGESRRPLQMGVYHPAVVATGEHVVSTRATGAPIPLLFAGEDAARPPGDVARYTSASGTSMAAPVTAGVAALVLEANPSLGPEAVKRVLQVTARSIPGAPFYRQGYGYLDAAAAVELARSLGVLEPDTAALQLENQQAERDAAVLAALAHPTQTWSWLLNGPERSSGPTHTIQVPAGTSRIKVLSLFGALVPVGVQAPLRIFDADGREVAATGDLMASGPTTLDLDLHHLDRSPAAQPIRYEDLAFGGWTIRLGGPDAVELATIAATFADGPVDPCRLQAAAPLVLRLQGDEVPGAAPYPADPSFTYVGPIRHGTLGHRTPERRLAGSLTGVASPVEWPPTFVGPPLTAPLTVAGDGQAALWLHRTGTPSSGLLRALLIDLAPDGPAWIIAQTDEPVEAAPLSIHAVMVRFRIPTGYTLAAGHRLALRLDVTSVGSVGDTLLYDSDDYPSALKLPTGTLPAGCPTAAAVGLTPPLTDRLLGPPPSTDSEPTSGTTPQLTRSTPLDGPPTAPTGSGVPVDQSCSCLPFDPLAGTVKPGGWRTGLGGL